MDYTDIRKLAIEFSGLSGMDDTYTFYYDETNNSRKFRITEKDFNSSKDEDFVIGGLVYEGENRQFSLDKLFQSFKSIFLLFQVSGLYNICQDIQ